MSRAARRWTIVLARTLLTQERWGFTGSGQMFSPLEKDRLLLSVQKIWEDYQRQYPAATYDEFYRDGSLQLRQFAIETKEESRHPVYHTPEHHPLVNATAEYRVRDWRQALARLDGAEEYVYVGESRQKPDAQHYVWLLRGLSLIHI